MVLFYDFYYVCVLIEFYMIFVVCVDDVVWYG